MDGTRKRVPVKDIGLLKDLICFGTVDAGTTISKRTTLLSRDISMTSVNPVVSFC